MLTWVLQMIIISIIFIFLVHHLINFFKTTLTVLKIKDLVNSPTQKYENMFNVMSNKINSDKSTTDYSNTISLSTDELIPKQDVDKMKDELKNFFKSQLNNNSEKKTEMINKTTTDISMLSSSNNNLNFSSF